MKTIIVAGVTRSGLTMTMQMLKAGGYPCHGEYPAFEPSDIGQIPFSELAGNAIKVVDTHTQFPPTGDYHVILLRRNTREQAKSIIKFLNLVAGFKVSKSKGSIARFEKSVISDMAKIDAWAKRQSGLLEIDFESIISAPIAYSFKIADFVGKELSISAMASVVVKRTTMCYDGLLEATFIK